MNENVGILGFRVMKEFAPNTQYIRVKMRCNLLFALPVFHEFIKHVKRLAAALSQ